MIYTSSLDLRSSHRQSTPDTLRRVATQARAFALQAAAVMREAIVKSRAALARTNGFSAQ